MANFGVSVDTTPMASKMNSISENVNLTTGAVVVMKESLLKAEAEATDYLCKNINGGFLDLIASQIAQKSALSQSETKAYAMELAQQVKELATLQVRMSKDYAMITKRNISLFNNLNKELENRIIALDKDIIDFVKKDIKKIDSRIMEHIAAVPVNQSESLSVSQAIVAAHIKAEADRLIEAMYHYLKKDKEQKISTRRIMHPLPTECRQETCVPVACCTTASGNIQTSNVYVAQSLPERIASHIYNAVKAQFNNLPWTNGGAQERNDIKAEVNNLIEQNHLSERVAATMRKLMEKNNWKTTEKE